MNVPVILRRRRPGVSPLAIYAVLGIRPELVLDFDDEKYFANSTRSTFSNAITHSATTNATTVDSDGLLKWRAHNLLLRSEEFDNAAWLYASPSGSVSSNAVSAPNGTLSADEVTFTGAGNDYRYQAGVSAPANSVFRVWLRLESGTGQVSLRTWTSNQRVTANLTSEWQLFTLNIVSAESTGFGLDNRAIFGGDGVAKSVYAWGAHAYRSDLGGMVNNPDRGDSYVPTTSSAVYLPRRGHHVYNGTAWVNEGLLHESEQRVNLQAYSVPNSSWTVGSTTITENVSGIYAPDGGENWSLIKETAAVNPHFTVGSNNIAYTSGVTYTISVFVKKASTDDLIQLTFPSGAFGSSQYANFNASTGAFETVAGLTTHVEDFGAGVYRVGITASATATAASTTGFALTNNDDSLGRVPSYLGDVTQGFYIWGFQVEAGSTPSSYIPNAGATSGATRAAETLTVPSAKLPWPTPNVIGEELWNTPTISDPAVWSWDGTTLTATGDGTSDTARGDAVTAGGLYQISFTVGASGSGLFQVRVGNTFIATLAGGANQTYSYLKVASDTTGLTFTDTGSTTAVISDISVREIDPLAVSIQMQGRMTYADTGSGAEALPFNWQNGQNYIAFRINTASTLTGRPQFLQKDGTTEDIVQGATDYYSPGINVPFNIASRHGSTFINGAVDGTEIGVDITPTALPDLETTDFDIAPTYMGTIKMLRIWADDLGDTGIEEASS